MDAELRARLAAWQCPDCKHARRDHDENGCRIFLSIPYGIVLRQCPCSHSGAV
jgi:hypothetical protein